MRSQPEEISESELTVINIDDLKDFNFGYLYEKSYNKTINKINVWSFTFSVDHADVFNNGINDLGSLSDDCNQVPMILRLEETFKLFKLTSSLSTCLINCLIFELSNSININI
jgi:hypothetical protein